MRSRWLIALAGGVVGVMAVAVVMTRASEPAPWRRVSAGVEHRAVALPGGASAEVFRVRLAEASVQVIDARDGGSPRATVRVLRERITGAVLATNAGFFDEAGEPMGLVITQGRETNSLRRTDWGVFWVGGERAGVMHTNDWRDSPVAGATDAIQSGPRLVVGKKPLKLKAQVARRTVVCVRGGAEVMLVVTEAIDARELARWLARDASAGGLGCDDALNLDGGPSTQLSLESGERSLEIRGGWPVPNALVVVPRP